MSAFVDFGIRVACSSREHCRLAPLNGYGKTIHIYRDDKPENSCKCAQENSVSDEKNLVFEYKDGYPIEKEKLQKVYEFIKGYDGKVLVHCHAGKTRSPTLAWFVASVFNKVHPFSIFGYIFNTYYSQCNSAPNICLLPIDSIMEWWDSSEFKEIKFA